MLSIWIHFTGEKQTGIQEDEWNPVACLLQATLHVDTYAPGTWPSCASRPRSGSIWYGADYYVLDA